MYNAPNDSTDTKITAVSSFGIRLCLFGVSIEFGKLSGSAEFLFIFKLLMIFFSLFQSTFIFTALCYPVPGANIGSLFHTLPDFV